MEKRARGSHSSPVLFLGRARKGLVNGWMICSMNEEQICSMNEEQVSPFSHPHTLKELGMDLCSDRQNPWEDYRWLSSKESSQKGTDNYTSLMSRHLLPALCQTLSQNHLCVKHTQTQMDGTAPCLHLLGHLMASVIA